jgi:hypothetical protein
MINERKAHFHGSAGERGRAISKACFLVLLVYVLGSWAAWIWGAVTGNN